MRAWRKRWRESEFLIGRPLTQGFEQLEVKIESVPNRKDLYPGQPLPGENVWSESRYWVYCYRMPEVKLE